MCTGLELAAIASTVATAGGQLYNAKQGRKAEKRYNEQVNNQNRMLEQQYADRQQKIYAAKDEQANTFNQIASEQDAELANQKALAEKKSQLFQDIVIFVAELSMLAAAPSIPPHISSPIYEARQKMRSGSFSEAINQPRITASEKGKSRYAGDDSCICLAISTALSISSSFSASIRMLPLYVFCSILSLLISFGIFEMHDYLTKNAFSAVIRDE